MGNTGSHGSGRRRHRSQLPEDNLPPPPPQTQPQPPPPEAVAERLAAATPYPAQYPNPNQVPYYHYHGYYPQPPAPSLYIHQFRGFPGAVAGSWGGGAPAVPCSGAQAHNPPYVDHQKAVTIRNDVNVKKETLRVEPDEENPGKFLVAFTFDATVSGSLTIMFFAKEDPGFKHIVSKESSLESVVMPFEQGLGQKFRQQCGTGIDFSAFDEAELSQGSDGEVYPLVVKAEAGPAPAPSSGEEGSSAGNSQITQAVFEKDRGQYRVRVSKQILWVGSKRYELQEIYGIGNSVSGGDYDENESGKECVICLSEPRDTTVLPCRHMCMCSGCAKVLRFQTDRCPICRQPVERLLEIKVNNGPEG